MPPESPPEDDTAAQADEDDIDDADSGLDATRHDEPAGAGDGCPDGEEAGSDGGDAAVATDAVVDRRVDALDLWQRWDADEQNSPGDDGLLPLVDLHLHRYCPVPFLDSDPEPEAERPDVQFLRGPIRTGVRHTPTAVLVVTVLFVVGAEFSPSVGGVSVFFPRLGAVDVVALVGAALVWGAILGLTIEADLVEGRDLLKALVVYGTFAVLAAGTVGSIYLVLTAEDPSTLPPNIIYTSGYLLTLLVGGLLIYDGMMRTEYLFQQLDNKEIVDSTPGRTDGPYERFRADLVEKLTQSRPLPVVGEFPIPFLFAPLFVSQFAAVWWVTDGPQALGFPLTYAANVFVDLFIAVVAFQFLVLLKGFYELVTDEWDGESTESLLTYRPFHPDARGGFRDFGRFATRVNLILIVGGLFLTYRLLVQGARVLPTAMGSDHGAVLWMMNFSGPVVAYGLVALAWLYYSFWELHRKMARERQESYLKRIEKRPVPDNSPEEAAAYGELRTGPPVWPIGTTALASLVSGTLAPVVVALPRLLS